MTVKFVSCPIFQTPQGKLLKYIRQDHKNVHSFGESYFSWLNPGTVKGWYLHKRYKSYMTSPTCNLHLAIFNEEQSFEFKLTSDSFGYVIIPKGYYYAMKSLDQSPSLIVNTLDNVYEASEVERRDVNTFESWFINA